MNDKLERLLSRLDKVERLSPGNHQARYKACCPAHGDKNPSLSITLSASDTILLKCWAGCSAHDVVNAVGMEMTDLFPDSVKHHVPTERRPFSADQAAKVIAMDALTVAMAAAKIRNKESLIQKDMDDLLDIHVRATTIGRGL